MDSQGDSLIAIPGFGRGFSFVISQRKNHGSGRHLYVNRSFGGGVARFLGLIVAVLVSLFAVDDAKAVQLETQYYGRCPFGGPDSGEMASRQAICSSSWAQACAAKQGASGNTTRFERGACNVVTSSGGVLGSVDVVTGAQRCPDNSTLDPGGNSCSCDKGWVENATKTACEAPPPKCNAGRVIEGTSSETVWGNGASSGVFCVAGCQVYGGDRMRGSDGRWWVYGPFTESGGECSPPPSNDPPPPDTEPPNTCKKGQCPGTVNGVAVCVPCSETTNEPPKPTNPASSPPGSQPAGGQNNTNTTTKPNADGGTTTTTTSSNSNTSCTGDKCRTATTTTTTTTVRGPDGSVTSGPTTTSSSSSEDKPRSTFCAENPKSWMCTGPETSSFGGSCGGAYVCQGDAIQCAIAQDQLKRNCQAYDAKGTLEQNEYASGVGKTGNITLDNPNNATSTMSGPNSRGDLLGGGGGGVADKSVQILGGTFVIPMTQLNDALPWIGYAFLALCTIVAFMIIWRRDFA